MSWAHWSAFYWIGWFLTVVITFLAVEIPALVSGHSEGTLSDNVWRLLNTLPGQTVTQWTALHLLVFGMWATFGIWLTAHFFFGLFR